MNKKIKVMTLLAMLLLSTLLFLTPTCVYAETLAWRYELVDSSVPPAAPGGSYMGTSLALDSMDRPHITYNYVGELYYTRWTGTEWIKETVDGLWDNRAHSLALDSANIPHISYYEEQYITHWSYLYYATWTGTEMAHTTVAYGPQEDDVGQANSIAVDSNDNPHIIYTDDYYLWYARWTGTEWIKQQVETAPALEVALALDSANRPHIIYGGNSAYMGLNYARWTGTEWIIETIEPEGAYNPALALDSANRPHISYLKASNLYYARWTGTEFLKETLDTAIDMSKRTSIALDSADRPHISYTNGSLNYARWTGTTWDIQTLYPQYFVDLGWTTYYQQAGWYSSIALDSADRPHISYADNRLPQPANTVVVGDLKYATTAGAPPPEAVDVVTSDSAGHFSVSIDAGADKGAPITYWWEVDTTNIATYTGTLTDEDMVLVIEGQLEDPSLPGQIVLNVDPPGEVITYSIDVEPLSRDALWNRLVDIILAWPTSTAEQRAELWEDIVEIILLWPTAP